MNIDQELLRKGQEIPVINHQPLPKYAMENLDYGMTIGLAITNRLNKAAGFHINEV